MVSSRAWGLGAGEGPGWVSQSLGQLLLEGLSRATGGVGISVRLQRRAMESLGKGLESHDTRMALRELERWGWGCRPS